MRISSKGKYALEIMVYLAKNYEKGTSISINTIAGNNELSIKYLEKIVHILHKEKLVKSERGTDGGYKLVKDPSKYTILEILKAAEGNIAPIKCVENEDTCQSKHLCKTYPLWNELYNIEIEYLANKKLSDIL